MNELLEQSERLTNLANNVDLLINKLEKEEDYNLSDGLFFLSESLREISQNIKTYEKRIKNS